MEVNKICLKRQLKPVPECNKEYVRFVEDQTEDFLLPNAATDEKTPAVLCG